MNRNFYLALLGCSIFQMAIITQEPFMHNKNVYAVILAGGSGERLWPLSRQEKPKQLLTIAQKGTLLDQSIDRIMDYIPKDNIWISTTLKFNNIINEYVGNRVGAMITRTKRT